MEGRWSEQELWREKERGKLNSTRLNKSLRERGENCCKRERRKLVKEREAKIGVRERGENWRQIHALKP